MSDLKPSVKFDYFNLQKQPQIISIKKQPKAMCDGVF